MTARREFRRDDLSGALFEEVDLSGAQLRDVTLEGATLREVNLTHVRMVGVELAHAVIEGDLEGLVVNGVEIGPLVEDELDRRHPGRALLRSTDPDELRAGWAWLEREWAQTTAEALGHPESSLRMRVDDEWSFVETLRHLVFATDSWLGVGVQGVTAYDPLGIAGPWFDHAAAGLDPSSDPPIEDVLAARAAHQAQVREALASATGADLAALSQPTGDLAWPRHEPMPVLARLHVILDEEWWHRQFALRDMAQWPAP